MVNWTRTKATCAGAYPSAYMGSLVLGEEVKGASPQGQPLLHLPEETRVEPVQRLKGGEDRVLQGVRSRFVLSHNPLERLRGNI